MKYENTAILTDLDGTLFNSQGLVSDEDRAAIARCVAFVNLEVFTVVPAEERSPPTI